jgi:hypothetical protein
MVPIPSAGTFVFTGHDIGGVFGTNTINKIVWDGGKYVAVGGGGKIAYSADGVSWTEATSRFTGSYLTINGIAYSGSAFVAVGVGGQMSYSADGINWTAITPVTDTTFSSDINGIAWADPSGDGTGSIFVAVGHSGKIAWSEDGLTWTAIPSGTGSGTTNFAGSSVNDITWTGTRFVAVGRSGIIAYSTDGKDWNAGTNSSGSTRELFAVAGNDDNIVAVGDGSTVLLSTDGENWNTVTVSGIGTQELRGVGWVGGDKFLFGASGGRIAYSSDNGANWAVTGTVDPVLNSNQSLQNFCWDGSHVTAAGYSGGGNNQIYIGTP